MKKPVFTELEDGSFGFETSTFDLVDYLIVLYDIYPVKEVVKDVWVGYSSDEKGRGKFYYKLSSLEKDIVNKAYIELLNESENKLAEMIKKYVKTHRATIASFNSGEWNWS